MPDKESNTRKKRVAVMLLQAEDFPGLERKFNGIDLNSLDLQAHEQGELTIAVAWIGPEAVGIGMVNWAGPRNAGIAGALPGCPELHRLFVDASYRERGIATQIILKLEQIARQQDFDQMGLGVGLTNDGAHGLYKRLGYLPAGLPEYIDKGELGERCIFLVHNFHDRNDRISMFHSRS
ncbi:GNAT family N-acetyltransferase [Thermodesulfobacteriota bacterium]